MILNLGAIRKNDGTVRRRIQGEITMNREYNLSGKEPISYIDLVRTVSRALGKSNVMVPVEEYLQRKRSSF